MIRLIAPVLLIMALLAAPLPTYAQSEPQPPATPAPVWSSIPDLVGYISIAVPQCATLNIGPGAEAPVNWFDLGSVIGWLSANIETYTLSAVCWGGYYLQVMANGISNAINLVLGAINGAWRMLIFGWLTIRNWILSGWYVVELARQWWFTVEAIIIIIRQVIETAWAAFSQFLSFIGQVVLLVVQAALIVINGIGWLIGLIVPAILLLFQAIGWSDAPAVPVPVQLAVEERYYCATHGVLRGFITSNYTNWIFIILFALVYIGFIFWLSRFLSDARVGGQQ